MPRRPPSLSTVCFSAVLAGSTPLADPRSSFSGEGGAPRPGVAAAPIRQAAAQADLGGGFIEFLFGGQTSGQRNQRGTTVAGYPQYPADLGPGMIESPTQPGRLVMDPRFLKQEVSYDGHEPPGTIIINTQERMLYL